MHERVYIGIGSNLGPRHATIHAGLRELGAREGVRIVRVSLLVETDPVGPPGQGAYLNGACELRTSFEPHELLEVMLEIERDHGRVRDGGERWGPRTLDLDLLVFGDRRIDLPGLTVPHPRMHERPFVTRPLAELGFDAASLTKDSREPGA
ncbi:MAG: 2-amino-4-hydroxy-6-hydroxymethyldihydropteridine diphosphokinase [Planctomycetota bacterium]